MSRSKYEVLDATKEDIPSILEIYNWAIQETTATFDTEIKTLQQQTKWYENHGDRHPVIVAKVDHKVIGWGSITRWSDRSAYDCTGEVSFYVLPEYQGQGIGKELLSKIISLGRDKDYRTLLSRIAEGSEASVHLHKKLGFEDIGTMKNAGEKFGKVLDIYFMQYLY
jgi:L-amino acid N-acyltransferase YncA